MRLPHSKIIIKFEVATYKNSWILLLFFFSFFSFFWHNLLLFLSLWWLTLKIILIFFIEFFIANDCGNIFFLIINFTNESNQTSLRVYVYMIIPLGWPQDERRDFEPKISWISLSQSFGIVGSFGNNIYMITDK